MKAKAATSLRCPSCRAVFNADALVRAPALRGPRWQQGAASGLYACPRCGFARKRDAFTVKDGRK